MRSYLLSLSFLCSFSLWGGVEKFTLDGHKISITIPAGWESVIDLFGMPLVVLGPETNETRPAVMILSTNLSSKNVPQSELKNLFKGFRSEKEAWIKSHKGELVDFQGPTSVEIRKDLIGQFLNAEFKFNDVTFLERSYYLYCKDNIYNVKYSTRAEHAKLLPTIQNLMGTFQCE